MSPSGDTFAVSFGSTLRIFSSEDEQKGFLELNDVHGVQRILVIKYSQSGRLIATCGDRYVRVFRNIPEYHSQGMRLTKDLKDVTGDAPRIRMLKQIEETKQILEKYGV
ncbi:hypothetical protein V3C99_011405 [Haemonchus contortus]